MGKPKASFKFEFPIWRYDKKELDRNKTRWFEKGEELPQSLVLILSAGNPEYVDFDNDVVDKIEDKEKGDKIVSKKVKNWESLDKKELDKFAAKMGIELDRRKSLKSMQEDFRKEYKE